MKKLFLIAFTAFTLLSCNDSADNTSSSTNDSLQKDNKNNNNTAAKEERNKQTTMASLAAIAKGDAEVILKDADKDMIDYGEGSMPTVKGADSVKAWIKSWLAAIPDYKGSDLMYMADGDHVMVYGIWTGTWKNDLMGMKATGKSFKVADVDIFKFNDDGKMVEHRAVQSMGEIARQIGMKMPTQ